jgi:mediator of RNA polymerase II transcription subunit 31
MSDSEDLFTDESDAVMSDEEEVPKSRSRSKSKATPVEEEGPEGEHEEEVPPESADAKFIRDLEFVQCLANPRYLYHLMQRNYFGDPAFRRYLNYLSYWERPEYAKFLRFPQCIHFLRLLDDNDFRSKLRDLHYIEWIEGQQSCYWHFYGRNRRDLNLPEIEVKEPVQPEEAKANSDN